MAIFGQSVAPLLPYGEQDLLSLGQEALRARTVVTGVQPKVSLDISDGTDEPRPKRFTVVGLWGAYILKPPSTLYPGLPEVEDLSMQDEVQLIFEKP